MTGILRFFAVILATSLLAGCEVNKETATPEEIQAVAYKDPSPPSLTLYTMVSNDTGKGGHTSLLINASQRVAWDPAGSFRAESIVTSGDVVYGMTPKMVDYYTRFHARETYHIIIQELPVSAEVAEMALQKARGYGAVPQATCALSTSAILQSLPGFESISSTYYPVKLYEDFKRFGPVEKKLFEYDAADKTKVLAQYNAELVAEQRAARKKAAN